MTQPLPSYIVNIHTFIMAYKTYRDEAFVEAVENICNYPVAYTHEIADIIGCNKRIATARCLDLVKQNKLICVKTVRGYGFRLPSSTSPLP